MKDKKKTKQISKGNENSIPKGCFCVYVGAERQRFVIKIEVTNHRYFQILLEEAENEYEFHYNGPIWLPCNVDVFHEIISEIEDSLAFKNRLFPHLH